MSDDAPYRPSRRNPALQPPPVVGLRITGERITERVVDVARRTGTHPQTVLNLALQHGLPVAERELATKKESTK